MAKRRFVYINGEAIEVSKDWTPEPVADYHVMGDIAPYRSMVDGSIITSRSRHREHLRDHGCVEIGNDSSLRGKPKPIESPPGLKETIIRATNEVERKLRRSY